MKMITLECGACSTLVKGKADDMPNGNWFDRDYVPYATDELRAHFHQEHPDPAGEYMTLRFAERVAAEGLLGAWAGDDLMHVRTPERLGKLHRQWV